MTEALDFTDVFSLVRGALNPGRLKLNKSGAIFKSTKTGKIESIPLAEFESSHWMRVARGFGLKITQKNGQQTKFHGFKEIEYEKLKDFYTKSYEMELTNQELCVKGWNWGEAKFKGSIMSFEVGNKAAFEIPLKDVSQATTGKNEVTIEFHRNDEAHVQLMEMRFFVPEKEGADDAVQAFHDNIMSKADIIQATGDAIVTFDEVACLTPRGRYSIRVYPTFLQLHGKTYDYKIPHTTVLRLFLLPHQDNRFMFFVISMDPPLRQGNTRYPFLILQFERDEEMTCKLNLTEEEMETKYNNKLSADMSGSVFEIVSRVLKEVCQRKITVPGGFKGKTGTNSISCSYKASSGLLYPLERGFIFVHKPPVHIRLDEISSVNFARGSTTGRTFDFELDLKNGTAVIFSSLPKDEYSPLFDHVNQKKLRIKNKGATGAGNLDQMIESDDDEHDAYLQRMKAEGAERDEDNDDDDSESEDEDFNPANEKHEDVAEEYDSDAGNSGSSDSEGEEGEDGEKKENKRKSESKPSSSKPKKPKKADEGSSGKKKAKKDKNAPKRPMSGFMLYMNEMREQIKKDNPGIAFTEIGKKGGEMWKQVTDKSKWERLAKEAKERYEVEKVEYKKQLAASGGVSKSPEKKKSKTKSIKDMMQKKDSPAKSAGNFKSKEYISTSEDSSDEEKEKKTKKEEAKKPTETKKKDESEESEDEDFAGGEKDSSDEEEAPTEKRSTRSKPGEKEEFKELKEFEEGEEEAEYSGGESEGGGDSGSGNDSD